MVTPTAAALLCCGADAMVLGMRGDDVASLEVSIEQRRVAGHAEVVALREAAATLGNYRCVLLRFV